MIANLNKLSGLSYPFQLCDFSRENPRMPFLQSRAASFV
jgi:hypothetical protein